MAHKNWLTIDKTTGGSNETTSTLVTSFEEFSGRVSRTKTIQISAMMGDSSQVKNVTVTQPGEFLQTATVRSNDSTEPLKTTEFTFNTQAEYNAWVQSVGLIMIDITSNTNDICIEAVTNNDAYTMSQQRNILNAIPSTGFAFIDADGETVNISGQHKTFTFDKTANNTDSNYRLHLNKTEDYGAYSVFHGSIGIPLNVLYNSHSTTVNCSLRVYSYDGEGNQVDILKISATLAGARDLTVTPTSINASREGGTQNIEIQTPYDITWTASLN